MKFLHIGDLHIGKKYNNLSMLSYQSEILDFIVNLVADENISVVIMAGDVYDKPVPSAEAITLFDSFITKLSKNNISIIIISGNHDSPERLQFAKNILKENNIFISGTFSGKLNSVSFHDEYGTITVSCLPFIKLAQITTMFPDADIKSLGEAVKFILENSPINTNDRNIMVYHGWVINNNSPLEGLGDTDLGGIEPIDADIFSDYDYTALGHVHRPQWAKSGKVRYSGSIIKCSFREHLNKNSVTVADFKEKGNIQFNEVLLPVPRDVRVISGDFDTIMKTAVYSEDFIKCELSGTNLIPYAFDKLKIYYPNTLEICYPEIMADDENFFSEVHIAENHSTKSKLQLMQQFLSDVYNYNSSGDSDSMEILKEICAETEVL